MWDTSTWTETDSCKNQNCMVVSLDSMQGASLSCRHGTVQNSTVVQCWLTKYSAFSFLHTNYELQLCECMCVCTCLQLAHAKWVHHKMVLFIQFIVAKWGNYIPMEMQLTRDPCLLNLLWICKGSWYLIWMKLLGHLLSCNVKSYQLAICNVRTYVTIIYKKKTWLECWILYVNECSIFLSSLEVGWINSIL